MQRFFQHYTSLNLKQALPTIEINEENGRFQC